MFRDNRDQKHPGHSPPGPFPGALKLFHLNGLIIPKLTQLSLGAFFGAQLREEGGSPALEELTGSGGRGIGEKVKGSMSKNRVLEDG